MIQEEDPLKQRTRLVKRTPRCESCNHTCPCSKYCDCKYCCQRAKSAFSDKKSASNNITPESSREARPDPPPPNPPEEEALAGLTALFASDEYA